MIVTDTSLSQAGTLTLMSGKTSSSLAVTPALRTNSTRVLIDAIKSGRGIGTAQALLIADDLRQGSLVRVLARHEIEPSEVYLTYPSSRLLRPLVRSFIDFSLPLIRRIDGITR